MDESWTNGRRSGTTLGRRCPRVTLSTGSPPACSRSSAVVVAASSPNPRGLVTGVAAAVDGRRLESVEAVGKHLLLRFENGRHDQESPQDVREMDDRPCRFGTEGLAVARAASRGDRGGAVEWAGSHARHARGPASRARSPRRRNQSDRARTTAPPVVPPDRPLGEALQDQRLVAGIGNMWMSEALWEAGLSPWLPLASVDDAELVAALTWARETMRSAVVHSRPHRSVYRRAGRPCRRCGEIIRARGQGDDNRTAYWCPGCQRGPSPRPS